MTAAYFEDHPTDPDKVIFRMPRLDQGADYERGFIDGMQYQMQTSVDKAVNAMSQQEQGEPVAWEYCEEVFWHTNQNLNDYIRANGTPLYTTPQPKEQK